MRSHLFAVGVSLALLVGAASPALAKPGHGQANGHTKPAKTEPVKGPKAPKAPKSKAAVNGGGTSAGGAEFSVNVRQAKPRQSHLNYTSSTVKIRCKDLQYSPVVYIQPGDPGATVTGKCVEMKGRNRSPISVEATFFDRGETGDEANFTFTREDGTQVVDGGVMTAGGITVRS